MSDNTHPKPRVCAVSYLNTMPLVWGMLHGRQRASFDLEFCLPSECADRLAAKTADIGIVPVIEVSRQGLEVIPGTGIACRGPVRSILLISKVPFSEVRTLAADSSSRTSVVLARIVLAERYGSEPRLLSMKPDLVAMLDCADAALIIGDPALRLDPADLPFLVTDLGQEWTALTGLPMVFAVWAGQPGAQTSNLAPEFADSCRYGIMHMEDIVAAEHAARGISPALAREYLTRHIVCELAEADYQGMERFLEFARDLERSTV